MIFKKLFFVLFSFLFFLLLSFFAEAQKPQGQGEGKTFQGKISGIVVDSETSKPLEFATIALYKDGDSLVTGAIIPANGKFQLEQIPFGKYRIEGTFIGYKTFRKDSIFITPDFPEVKLGKLSVLLNSELLGEVEVTAEKNMLQMSIDKKVFNVEKNITSAGGSANDVLQNIPSVSVDIDGNISLRGSGNVTVLIDGRPSGITGSSRAAVLQQIPANSIESIEVITNPSVKYDPDGMSGIINIVLKKNQNKGANGTVSAGAGSRNKYNASANFNYRSRKMNSFVNYSYRYNPHFRRSTILSENFFTDSTWYLNQSSNSLITAGFHMVKTGFDFFLNDKNTIGVSATYNGSSSIQDEAIEYQNLDNNKSLTNLYFRNNTEKGSAGSTDVSFYYKRSFQKPKQQLTADIAYSNSMENEDETYNQPADSLLQNTFNKRKNAIITAQADYTHPFGKSSKFETGYKSIIRNIDNNFSSETYSYPISDWASDPLLNNHYIYKEQVHATYATLAGSIQKFGYQFGSRLEQALTSSELLLTDTAYENNYFSYFPGAHLSYKLSKKHELQLSYSKRINRPSVQSLIAWLDLSDPQNIRIGNPNLRPEYIHSVEFSYALTAEKHTLTSSVYYRQINDMIQRFRTVDSSGVATIQFQNYAGATNYGFEFVARNELFKWWNITSNINLFKSIINADNLESDLHNEGFSWSAKMTSNLNLPDNFQIQISGNYSAPRPVALGIIQAMYSVDLGVKKEVLKKKGIITLNISDIFDTRQFGIDIIQPAYNHSIIHKRESQIVTLNFTYNFGKTDPDKPGQKQKGKRDSESQPISGEDLF